MIDISLETFQKALSFLQSQHLNTPLVPFPFLKTSQGNSIYLKAECLQPSGSFKIRGATYSISELTDSQKNKGVIAYSTGNHAQAVALAAKLHRLPATIVMSPEAPDFKVKSTKEYGAEIIMVESSSEFRRKTAEQLALEKGCTLIPPYDHPHVLTGQGTIGLEILDAIDPSVIFVPVGGGGLIAGIAMAIKKSRKDIKIIGVEPELEKDGYESFHAKKRISMKKASDSIADAIKIQVLGEMTFPLICHYVDDMITVNEEEIAQATLMILQKSHLFVEPSGALALAGALRYPTFPNKRPVVCIASGGNTTLDFLCSLQSHSHIP
jgi:threonine dehydratase